MILCLFRLILVSRSGSFGSLEVSHMETIAYVNFGILILGLIIIAYLLFDAAKVMKGAE